ncbi:MAG: hypothetical protein JNL50_14870 [Phycisphaerae bacterium]|nr:hypothetical protein [Phycisphaerae bacterium]
MLHGGEVTTTDPADLQPDPENLREINALSSRAYASRQRALDSIYVYEGEVATPIVDNLPAHSLTIPMTAFEAAYRAASFGEDLANQAGLDDAQELTRDEVFDALTAAMNLDVADGSPTMPADLGWEVPANWTRRVKYLYTEPSFTQRSPEGDKVYNERNFFGSLSVRDSLVYGEPDEAAFYNMTWPGNDAGAMTEIAPMLIASRTDTRVEVTTAANTTETVTSTRHWLANYEMVDQGVSEEFFTRSPVIKSVWSSGTLAMLGKTIDDAGVTASDDAKFARAHWPLGLLLVKEATEFPRVGDPESDEKLLLHQTADYTLRDWWAREDVSAAGAIGTPDGKNDDFYDDNGDFWKEAADAVATSSGGKQLRMDAGVGVFTDRRSGALRPRTYKVRKFIIMPGNREFSVGGSPGYLTAHPGGPISGTGGTGGLFLRNSIHHAPYVFYGAAGMIGEPSSDPSVIPFGQTGEGDFVPALGEPLWATIIDEYDGESKARTAITASLASIVASGNDIEIEKLPLTRRLVWMNAAGYVLKEQVWDVRSGELASDQGFITETDLDDYGRVLERRSPGWGSYANKDNRHDKGRIDVYGYDGDSREPSLVGMKQGTEGTVYYTTQVFRNTVRSDLIDATVQFTTPSTTALSSIPDLDNLPAGVVATRTEYILGTPLWDPEGGTSADPIPNSNPIYQKLDYGAAASSEPGGTPRRAFAAEIYNYGSNNDTPLVADQPMGALLWKGYGQVASPSGAAPGDEVFWDYTRYDDRGRVIATIVDAASGVNFGDSDQGFTEIPVPGYPLTQFSRQPAANDALRPALMLATLQWHSDLGTVKTKFPDGRFELTSYVCDDETSEVRKGLFVFENGAWRPVTSGGIQRYGGDAAEGGSIVTWPDNFQYFDGQIPASVIAEVEIENDSAGRPTEVSLSAGDAEGVTGQIEYDWFGLAARETAFDGTRTRKVTNLRGQLEMVWRGTKDKHALWGNLNNGEPDDNMILLEKNTYGTGVNDALKLVGVRRYRHAFTPTQAFGESGFAYFDGFGWLETHAYDWRGRDVLVRRYRESNGPNENPDVITTTATHLDHMDRAVLVAEYGGDLPSGAIDPTQAAAGAAPPSAAQVVAGGGGALLALTETIYDARGKVLTTRTYDPTDAAKYTESTTYADSRGSATWSRSPNAPVTIRVYDSQGREIRSTQLVGTLEIERTDTQRDTVGNAIRVVTRERVAGAGGDTLGENNSVRSYRFHWYDKSNRVIATLDAGTMNAANTHVDHGGGDRTRPDAPGDDPRELSSQDPQTQELLGLNTTWFGGLTGSASASKGLWAFELSFYDVKGNKARDIVCNRPGDAGDDRITDTRYDGFGQVVARVERTSADNATPPRTTYSKYQNGKVVAMGTNPDEDSADWINPTLGGFQKTEIEYGADIVVSPEPGILGTVSRNNGYIGLITFPSDEDTPPTSIAFTYYPDGLIATRSVRRGGVSEAVPEPLVTFGYGYDELSRLIEIRVWYPETLPPPGGRPVDRITRVEYAYDGAGRLTAATAYTTNPSTSAEEIVSQNVLAYDPMGRLLSEQQQHAGVVTSASPVVSYAWEQDTAKNIERLTRIVYPARVNPTGGPSARTIEFGFGSADSIADLLSRVSTVTDVSATGALGQLAAYTYSGISRRVGASWGHGTSGTPAASYTTVANSGVGHSGLDAMGRLAALTVKNSAGSSTPLFEALYGYSPAGDLVTRRVTQAAIGGLSGGGADNTRSALFGHDRLGRLVEHEAGTLGVDANGAPEITSLWRRSAWSMDTLGNLAGTPAIGGNPAAPGLVLEADRDGDSVLDVLSTTHDTARNNRLDEISRGDSIMSVVDAIEVVNDRAGNVVCDGLYYYQYDAWNRLIQVRHKGSLEFDDDGHAASGTPGEWIVHYTYDALGRLIRRQLPHNLELEQVRIEEFYYDGVRRVSETLTTPLLSVGGGPIGGGGGGGGGGGSGETQTVTDREYVWAPPPSGYVDECVAQIDRTNAVRYVIQDASYDVAALVTPQTGTQASPQPSRVIAQYTWDPYGQVLTAEYAGLASTYNKLGHHGLFADRLDANYQSATLLAGFVSSTHLPARIVYNVRNRTYEPSTQRWLQRDPNATGQVVLGSVASHGQAATTPSGAVSAVELASLYGDGMSLYEYLGSEPVSRRDALGLAWDPFEEAMAIAGEHLASMLIGLNQAKYRAREGHRLAMAYTRAAMEWDSLVMDRDTDILFGMIVGPFFSTMCFEAGTPVTMADDSLAPIESIVVGRGVRTEEDPEFDRALRWLAISDPDAHAVIEASAWRRVEMVMEDVERGRVEVTLLRPRAWVVATRTSVGGRHRLHIPELGLDGEAEVTAIGACPPIESVGPSAGIVTGTFVTERAALVRLWPEGAGDSIGATARHPFYSEDRCAWVGAGELVEGERVRALGGTCRLDRVERIEESARVYNVEVHGTHTYYVGESQVCVHNECFPARASRYQQERWIAEVVDSMVEAGGSSKPHILSFIKCVLQEAQLSKTAYLELLKYSRSLLGL